MIKGEGPGSPESYKPLMNVVYDPTFAERHPAHEFYLNEPAAHRLAETLILPLTTDFRFLGHSPESEGYRALMNSTGPSVTGLLYDDNRQPAGVIVDAAAILERFGDRKPPESFHRKVGLETAVAMAELSARRYAKTDMSYGNQMLVNEFSTAAMTQFGFMKSAVLLGGAMIMQSIARREWPGESRVKAYKKIQKDHAILIERLVIGNPPLS